MKIKKKTRELTLLKLSKHFRRKFFRKKKLKQIDSFILCDIFIIFEYFNFGVSSIILFFIFLLFFNQNYLKAFPGKQSLPDGEMSFMIPEVELYTQDTKEIDEIKKEAKKTSKSASENPSYDKDEFIKLSFILSSYLKRTHINATKSELEKVDFQKWKQEVLDFLRKITTIEIKDSYSFELRVNKALLDETLEKKQIGFQIGFNRIYTFKPASLSPENRIYLFNTEKKLNLLKSFLKTVHNLPEFNLSDYLVIEREEQNQVNYIFFKKKHPEVLRYMFLNPEGIKIEDLDWNLEEAKEDFLQITISKDQIQKYIGKQQAISIENKYICLLQDDVCSGQKEFTVNDFKNILKKILKNKVDFNHPIYDQKILGRKIIKTNSIEKDIYFLLDSIDDFQLNSFESRPYIDTFSDLIDSDKVVIDVYDEENDIKIIFSFEYKETDSITIPNLELAQAESDFEDIKIHTYTLLNQSSLNTFDTLGSSQNGNSDTSIEDKFDALTKKTIPFDTLFSESYIKAIHRNGIIEYVNPYSVFLADKDKKKVFIFKIKEYLESKNLDENTIRNTLSQLKPYLDILKRFYQESHFFLFSQFIFFNSTSLNSMYFYIPTSLEDDEISTKSFSKSTDPHCTKILNSLLHFILKKHLKNSPNEYSGEISQDQITQIIKGDLSLFDLKYKYSFLKEKGDSKKDLIKFNAKKISFNKKENKIFLLIEI